jgi:hypothetical protein
MPAPKETAQKMTNDEIRMTNTPLPSLRLRALALLYGIGVGGKPTLMVCNKIDRFAGNGLLQKCLAINDKLILVVRLTKNAPT